MGLYYNYLLYFKRNQLWDVLQGLEDFCDTEGMNPTTIQFSDHDLVIPLMSSWDEKDVIAFNKPEIDFAILMILRGMKPFWTICIIAMMINLTAVCLRMVSQKFTLSVVPT